MAFSSMYIGATGVKAYSDGMQVVGNNLANVNTVGYRKADIHFNSLMYSQMATGSHRSTGGVMESSQMGKGVGVAAVLADFRQSALESSNEVTDLAIQGKGFFGVADPDNSGVFYTRAGNFRFDREGYLVNPAGYRLQGYGVDRETGQANGAIGSVQLPMEDVVVDGQNIRTVVSPPRATSSVSMITNLDRTSPDSITSSSNPFFAMLGSYDASDEDPLGRAPYTSSIKVYDENGDPHQLTVSFDPVNENGVSNASGGNTFWEYAVTVPASEDGRAGFQGTSQAGLLAVGTLSFGPGGSLVNMSAYTADAAGTLSNWAPADMGLVQSNGVPTFDVAFISSNGSTAAQTVGLDFGVSTSTLNWSGGASNAASVGNNAAALPEMSDTSLGVNNTSSFPDGSRTKFATQDGYTQGYLRDISISRDGFVEGNFSNGETERLAQLTLYRFQNDFGLRREGGNLFSASQDAGTILTGTPDSEAFGTTNQNSLEMSNTDMAQEFADMILTQRSFQSNTKVITTSDSILNTTINIKK